VPTGDEEETADYVVDRFESEPPAFGAQERPARGALITPETSRMHASSCEEESLRSSWWGHGTSPPSDTTERDLCATHRGETL